MTILTPEEIAEMCRGHGPGSSVLILADSHEALRAERDQIDANWGRCITASAKAHEERDEYRRGHEERDEYRRHAEALADAASWALDCLDLALKRLDTVDTYSAAHHKIRHAGFEKARAALDVFRQYQGEQA